MRLLVTGATGTIGSEVLALLADSPHEVLAGMRRPDRTGRLHGAQPVAVDLAAGTGPDGPFDAIFLMRPPQITDPALFRAFLSRHDRRTRIVFLSVLGADSRGYLPHAKIEKVIAEMGFPHLFVRPSYFMENLTTTLAPELAHWGRVYLPAGRLALDWVSARDIAAVIVAGLVGTVQADSVPVASGHAIGFAEALKIVNRAAGTAFRYEPAVLLPFLRHCRGQGISWGFIFVLLLLHYLPRFTTAPLGDPAPATDVLGRVPETLEDWAKRSRDTLQALTRTADRNL